MSFDLLKAVPIIHVTLSNMKRAVFHDGWSLSSPNYHHTDQYLTVNIDVLACMVSTSYLVQICRYAEMQICRYAPVSQDQKWHTQSGVTDPSGFNCCPSVRLKSSLDFPTVWQIESWEYFIYRPKYCLFAISAVGIPAMNTWNRQTHFT